LKGKQQGKWKLLLDGKKFLFRWQTLCALIKIETGQGKLSCRIIAQKFDFEAGS